MNRFVYRGAKKLRCGYTTGSCAAGAAKAAAEYLLTGAPPACAALMTPAGIALTLDILMPSCDADSAS